MKHQKTYRLIARIKGKDVPDFGIGPGVLSTEEVTFTDYSDKGFESVLFELRKSEHEERLFRKLLEFEWCPLTRKD